MRACESVVHINRGRCRHAILENETRVIRYIHGCLRSGVTFHCMPKGMN